MKVQWKKNCYGYQRAVEKREEQPRSAAAKVKLATCRHFNSHEFLHSVVSSQNTDSNVEMNFCENETDGQEGAKASQICTLSEKSSNQRSDVSSYKGKGKRRAGETFDLQLVEFLNNVNDAVKTIVGQSVVPNQNDYTLIQICFFQTLVSSLKPLNPKKNRLTELKFKSSYLKLSLEKIQIKHLH